MWETWIWSLGWGDPLEKGKADPSSILAWRIPWTVQSMGLQRVGHDWASFTLTFFGWCVRCSCVVVWIFLGLPFFGIRMKTDLFQSCGHCWVLQIYWHIECSILATSSFRILNSSVGIPSPPLSLFVVMHLTSHSRMSGPRWVITPSWLYGS